MNGKENSVSTPQTVETLDTEAEAERQIVAKVSADHPEVVQALDDFRKVAQGMVDRWRSLVKVLRAADLPPRHLTVVLLAHGFNKDSASKIKTVVESAPQIFEAFQKGEVGFKPTLEAARVERLPAAIVAVPAVLGEAFRSFVNGYNGVMPKRKAVLRAERLDWRFVLTLAPKARKSKAKGTGKATRKKKKAKK